MANLLEPDPESEDDYEYVDPFLEAILHEPAASRSIPLLYEGSRMSVKSFVAEIQFMKAKHGLSDVAVGDLLALFRDVLPRQNRCPGTVYKLAKITEVEFGSPDLEFVRICSDCSHLLGEDNKCHRQECKSFGLSQQACYGYGKIGLRWQIKRVLHGKLSLMMF